MLRKLAAVLTLLLVIGVSAAAAQDNRTVFWERWDVVIDEIDTAANRFNVTEIYNMDFGGRFSFGSAVIPTDRLNNITNVSVTQDGRALRQGCAQQPGTFCASNTSDGLAIRYYFFEPITDGSSKFEIAYTVNGALRTYEGGDQLWWTAIPRDHFGFPIGTSTITVQLPDGFAPREGIDPVVTYGAPADIQVNGTRVVATSTGQLGGNDYLEIRVQYPHDPNAQPPAWQSNFDDQRAFDENTLPLIQLGLIAISLVVGIGGVLFFYSLYMRKGRDPQIGPVPTYLSDPPSSLPPAIVGTLVDEKADPRDVISTVIDLASRGYMAIEETQSEGVFGIGKTSSFTFKRTDKPLDDLRPYERKLMNRLFSGNQMERTMDSLRDKFYSVISEIQGDLYNELVSEGFFETNPNSTRAIWSSFGVILLGVAVVGGFLLFAQIDSWGIVVACPGIALGLVAVAGMIIGPSMPAKTRKGAEEAAKWKAFYEYLQNLDKYAQVEEATDQFERYLPYAVAFGLDKIWIRRFSQVSTMAIPYWYFPTYVGRYRRGYMAGTPLSPASHGDFGADIGDLARAGGGGGLDQMSGGLAGGLESISSGLSGMLDSASRAMTSRPQQASSGSSGSWRSGGSSWSGGGFSGGGGSGGGSRGFG